MILLFVNDISCVIQLMNPLPLFHLQYASSEIKTCQGIVHPNSVGYSMRELVSILVLGLFQSLCFLTLGLGDDIKTVMSTYHLMFFLGEALSHLAI